MVPQVGLQALIRTVVKNNWQELWNMEREGRHLYKIQEKVGAGRSSGRERREESVVTRLRLGHTSTLKLLGKHPIGRCDHCQEEMEEYVLFQCQKYVRERE